MNLEKAFKYSIWVTEAIHAGDIDDARKAAKWVVAALDKTEGAK
jgi:hypothetical protein